MLAVARRRVAARGLGARIELLEGRAEALPFADASFDAADGHVPASLRRRPGRDHPRARPRRASGRNGGVAGVRRSPTARAARSLGALRADRAAARRTPALVRAGTRSDASSARASATTRRACRSSASSSCGRRPGSRTCARGDSASGAASSSGAGAGELRVAAGLLRARPGWLARLRDAAPRALHALASLLRRDRSGAGAGARSQPVALGPGGVPARARRGRPRTRRAPRPPAAHGDPEARAHLARRGVSDCRRRDRDRRRARVDAVVASVRRRRRLPRPRLRARACRRPLPQRSLVRARVGRFPGAGGVPGRGRDAAARGVSRSCVRAAHEPGAAVALDAGADGAAPGRRR